MARLAVPLILGVFLLPGPVAAGALGVTPVGPEETVFRWQTDRCAPNHIPDAPARAIRTADGRVRLIAAHHLNRAMTGNRLGSAKVDCALMFEGGGHDEPARWDDKIWLTAFHTIDGRRIAALGHAEYHGHKRPSLCPRATYMACWRNAVIGAVSLNGGRRFDRQPGAVAAMARAYGNGLDRHAGYFSPSNIIMRDNKAYAFVFAEAFPGQKRGACLIRSGDPFDPASWRAWDGRRFSVRLHIGSGGCAPITGLGSTVTSLVRHTASGTYLALIAGTRRKKTGVWVLQSDDLIRWSRPRLVIETPIMFAYACGARSVYAYPSLIDPKSRSRTFETVSGTAFLYLTRFNMRGCKLPMDRDLVRIPVRIGR